MRWTKFTLWLLAAALLVLCACGAKTGEPSIGDLTRPPVEQTTPEPAEPKPEQEPATTKGKSKGDKTASGKVDADKLETPEPDGALLAAYEAILERSVEVLASGGDIEIKDGETGLLEACYGGTGVGYAIEDLNADGVPELILGPADGNSIYALYTGSGSEPVLLLEGWYRNCWKYLGGGRFYVSGSGGVTYNMVGTFVLPRDGQELACEDFYFTYELDESFEEFGVFHNTEGLWDTSVSEQLDMTYDDLWALDEEWSAQAQPLDLTHLDVPISGPQVQVLWADGEWNGDYERVDLSSGDPSSAVLFLADSPVTDFRILSLFVEDITEDGSITFSSGTLCRLDVLSPDCALVADLTFHGDLPCYGISYTDANGAFWRFAIEISGYDSSISLSEF